MIFYFFLFLILTNFKSTIQMIGILNGGTIMKNTMSHNEMIKIVTNKLQTCNLTLQYPEIVAQSLLSNFDYDLDRVLELAV